MGEVYMGKLILTARGLNSETGQKIIRKCLPKEENREKKTILLVSIKKYGIDKILKQASMELGFPEEYIFLASEHIDLKKIQPDYIYVTEGNVYQVLDYMRKNGLLRFIQQQMKRSVIMMQQIVWLNCWETVILMSGKRLSMHFAVRTDTIIRISEGDLWIRIRQMTIIPALRIVEKF